MNRRLAATIAAAFSCLLCGSARAEDPARLVHDFFPDELEGSAPVAQLTPLGSRLFFVADDLDAGQGVWRTDGTRAGSGPVPVETGLSGVQIVGRLYFQDCGGEGAAGCVVWSTDGTPAGTKPVSALARFQAKNQRLLAGFADRWLVFQSDGKLLAYDRSRGRSRTPRSTVRSRSRPRRCPSWERSSWAPIRSRTASSSGASRTATPRRSPTRGSDPVILSATNRSLLFAATSPEVGRELWEIDVSAP